MRSFVAVNQFRFCVSHGALIELRCGDDQCVNLLECRDQQNNLVFYIDRHGKMHMGSGTVIPTDPPEGMYPVTNLYVDPATGRLVVKYDDGS